MTPPLVLAERDQLFWGFAELLLAAAIFLAALGTVIGVASRYLWSRASSVYGGSEQIQRNIIAQRILGLPRT